MTFHPDPLRCRCRSYARDYGLDDQHHRNCALHPARTSDLLRRLVAGIGAWAAEEDGVAECVWDAYVEARRAVNMEEEP